MRAPLLLLVVFVAIRGLVLVSSPYALFDDEEIYNGTAARELARGAELPFEAYLYFPHEGGALVMTVVAAGIVSLAGDSVVAVKLAPLILSALALLAWFRLADRHADRPTAVTLAALLCLAPPLVLRSDLMLWGHHNSVSLFVALAFHALLEVTRTGDMGVRRRHSAYLGLVCGFAAFFAYMFVVALLAVGVALLSWRPWRPETLRPTALGFAAGFSPWLLLNWKLDFAGLDVFLDNGAVRHVDVADVASKAWFLIGEAVPRSASFSDVRISMAHALLMSLAIVGTAALARSGSADQSADGRPRLAQLAWIYLASFLVLYTLSGFDIRDDLEVAPRYFVSYRYLLPLFPVAALLVAINATRPGSHPWPRRAAALLLGGLGVVSLTENVETRLGSSFDYPGYSYERFGRRWYERSEDRPSRLNQVAAAVDPEAVRSYYRGASWGLAADFGGAAKDAVAWIDQLPAGYQGLGIEGLGWAVADRSDGDLGACQTVARDLEEARRPAFLRGFGWATGKRHHRALARGIAWLRPLEAPARLHAYSGLGRVLDERLGPGAAQWIDRSPGLGEAERAALLLGAREAAVRRRVRRFIEGPLQMQWGPTAFYGYRGPETRPR